MPKLAKYELLTKLASGGMAEIYVARSRDAGQDRICVVKKLLPQHSADEDFIRMFRDEGRIAALFHHPNIVQMYDFGFEEGRHYLAMEYLHGEDLRSILRTLRARAMAMPLPIALAIAIGLCAGLHHAHETRGPNGEPLEIVHRDVSPHNVFVTFEGGVKVVDFGIAKSSNRSWETKNGTIKGKVPYMAPEQIKGRRVDRRTDIYAVGVLLYELVLGRRPYVLAANGDFAIMMAISRHDVRPPSQVDVNIAPELERIILGAMAYEPKSRYATAKALQTDLEAFARAARLDTSTRVCAAFIEGLFEARAEQWRAAQRAERDIAAHVVQIEQARAESGVGEEDADEGEDGVDARPTSIRPLASPGFPASLLATSAAVAGVIELFGVTVVSLQGRIDESFDGKALGGSLTGTVLFDMSGVERITSFGVREWLEMMTALEAVEDMDAYLSRCSEAVVTQLTMIKTFVGCAKVVSFNVPFLCDDCGNNFVHTIDCERDSAILTGGVPPRTCSRCGGEAKLDDDPSSFGFAAPFMGRPIPDTVRVVLQRIDEDSRSRNEAVAKVITASETRIRVHGDVDPAFRWNRVLDGVEGVVVVDFRGAPRFGRQAAERFARAIRGLGAEVTGCQIVECPVEVAVALGGIESNGRVQIESLAFEGRCESCAAARTGAVARRVLEEAHRVGAELFVPCRRCNGPLVLGDVNAVMNALFPPLPRTPVSSSVVSSRPVIVAAERARPRTTRRTAGIFAACLAVTGLAVLGTALARRGAHVPAASMPAGHTTSVVEHRSDGVYAIVTTGDSSEEGALKAARTACIERLLPELEHALEPAVRAANEATQSRSDEASSEARFVEQAGVFASPDRIDVKLHHDAGMVTLTATYRIASAAWQHAIAYYSNRRKVGGIVFSLAFPTRGRGLVVVAADAVDTIPVGSLVARVDGRPTTSPDALASLPRGRHSVVFSFRGEALEAGINVE